eukprot:2805490-Pyramimonas_sp.AAC.1
MNKRCTKEAFVHVRRLTSDGFGSLLCHLASRAAKSAWLEDASWSSYSAQPLQRSVGLSLRLSSGLSLANEGAGFRVLRFGEGARALRSPRAAQAASSPESRRQQEEG